MSCCFVLAHLALPCTSVRGSTHDLSPLELLNRKLHTIEDKPSAWSSKCGKSVDSLKLPCMSSGFIWFIQIPTTYMIIILSMYSFAFNPKKIIQQAQVEVVLTWDTLGHDRSAQLGPPHPGTMDKVSCTLRAYSMHYASVKNHLKYVPKTWIYGCFLKWWYPTTMGFPTKNDHFGVFWGYHHFRKPPYMYI